MFTLAVAVTNQTNTEDKRYYPIKQTQTITDGSPYVWNFNHPSSSKNGRKKRLKVIRT